MSVLNRKKSVNLNHERNFSDAASVFIFANPFPTISEKSLSNQTVNI